MELPTYNLYTDGSCWPNPGRGGWAYLIRNHAGMERERSGSAAYSTNNRMEIIGVVMGLESLGGPSVVTLYSDSEYVVKAITSWMEKWRKCGWRKSLKSKTQIKNADLWARLDAQLQRHHVTAQWIRGHDGHPENERCDELANAAAGEPIA